MHIDSDKLRYCPNISCQMPYEFLGNISNVMNTIVCYNCSISICGICGEINHPNMSCEDAAENNNRTNNLNMQYFNKYCKKCPHCNCIVQKLKTPQQEDYERITGMNGGTQECHHMTCSSCKQDFCWFCLGKYTRTRYYHPECPTSDCIVHFSGSWPSISGLPPGIYRYVDVCTPPTENGSGVVKQYNLINQNILLSAPRDKTLNNTIIITCNNNGIMLNMIGNNNEFTYRQENKAIFN